MRVLAVAAAVLLSALAARPAWAQAARGRLIITVVDTSGAVIPDSTVTVALPEPLILHVSRDAAGNPVNSADLYLYTPGVAGSLARVTRNVSLFSEKK